MLTLILLIGFWIYTVGSIKIVASFYSEVETLLEQKFYKILNILFLPYFLTTLYILFILFINNFIVIYEFKNQKNFLEQFMFLFKWGIIFTFGIAVYILGAGGTWHYSTKGGGRDYRYKYNRYYPDYDDYAKTVCQHFLIIPTISVIIFISIYLIQNFLGKK